MAIVRHDSDEATVLLSLLRSLSPDQLTLYSRRHTDASSQAGVEMVQAEREIREAIWPNLVAGLGEDRANAFWLNVVELDDHQAAINGPDSQVSIIEIFEAALEVTRCQFDNERDDYE